MKTIIINGKAVTYFEKGSGEPLLCIHGWLSSASTFDALANELSGFKIIAVDLPNFGSSDDNPTITSLDDYAAFIADFARKLNLKEYWALGHSMGGQIAIRACAQEKIHPEKLIIIAASGVRSNQKFQKTILKYIAKVLRPITPASIKKQLYRFIGSDYGDHLSKTQKQIIKDMLSKDIQQDAKKITCPTLLIYGSADTSTPPSIGEALHRAIPSSEFLIIENESHWLHETSAEQIVAFMKQFKKND